MNGQSVNFLKFTSSMKTVDNRPTISEQTIFIFAQQSSACDRKGHLLFEV